MRLKQCIFALMAMLLCAFSANAQGGSVAKIGDTEYTTFAEALTAASAMSGDVTIEVYDKVTLNTAFSGSYSSINFVGKDTDAEIYLDVQGYITATGKKVSFTDLTLSKSAGAYIPNAGFMNVAFGIYDVTEVAYTNCVFANGAYASSGNVTFNDCTFYRSYDKYGLWAYGNVDVAVEGCTFADYRGIKMYAEGAAKTVDLTVKNTDFSAVTDKPAIVLTYGESIVLEGNTYSSTGTFELDLDGAPNGTAVTSDVAPTCKNDNGTCGVLVDGKIYTTAAQAAAVATEGSNVTLLYSTTDTVEFAEGVNLTLANGVTADNVTVATSGVAKIGDTTYATLSAAFAAVTDDAQTVVVLQDVTEELTGAYLRGNITTENGAKVTINLTNSDWVYCPYTFVLGENITLNLPALFYYAGGAQINGAVITEAYYQRYAGTKLTINEPGSLTVTGETFIIRYTDNDANAGIYVNGDNNDETVGLNLSVAYFYQGMIYAKDANIKTSVYWQTNETDGQGSANLVLDNSTLNVTGSELDAKATGNSTVTLTNGSSIDIAGAFKTGPNTEVSVDATSSIQDANGPVVIPVAKVGDVEYTSLEDAFEAAAATAEATITLIEDLTIESDLNDAGKGYFNVADGKKVTLDLGGKTITATDNSTGNFILFYSYGEFTIKNGTVVLTATNDRDWNAQSTIVLNRGGIFNCESGTYTHNGGTDMAFVFDNSGNYYGDATTNIKGGELTSTYIAIRNRMEQNSHGASGKAILNVTGGKINGTSRAVWAQAASISETAPATGAINVSGGEVGLIDTPRSTGAVSMTTISGGTVAAFKGEAGELTVKGGTIGNVEILTAAGEATDYAITADGVYAQAVAKIGETSYATLQAAFDAVKDGETITLIDNVTVSVATAAYNDGTYIDGVRYTGDKSFTVDFNGKTVTDDGCVNDYLIYINNKGEKASEITFTNGTIVSKNGCWSAVCVNSSAATQNVVLNLNGMNITNSNDAEYSGNPVVRVRNLATVNVNDKTVITSNGASYGVAANTDGSTLNINEGATIVQQNSGTTGGNSVFAAVGGKGVINIKGGTITSDKFGVHTMTTGTPVINISGGTITAPVALKSSTNGGNGELATINVTGGTINGTLETYTENGKIVVSGGTFSKAVAQEYCAEGYAALQNLDGNYVVGVEPTATVNNLGMTTVAAGDYSIWNGSFDQNTEDDGDMPLSFVMQFLADQDAEDMETSPYADWYGDFVITFTGLENGSFTADGCYLAGHYGSFGWVKVPVDGMTIEEGARYPVMLGVGLGQKYDYICSGVQDFKCALYLTPEILEANPNIQVKLELAVVDNSKGSDAAASALISNENVYSVTEYTYVADDFVAPKDPEVVDGKIEFVDGEFNSYTNDTDIENVEITYKRTIDSDWNALYVPFAIPASELLADFDIAYINDVRETDADDDGELDGWQMELIKIKNENAELRANHPYFIRSKSADYTENNLSLTLTTTLYKATVAEVNCSSMYSIYTIKGLNELRASTEFGDADRVLGYDNGETTWGKMADGYSLKPFRFYLTITNRDGSPVVSSSAQMSIVVRDEDGTTGIDGIYGDENGETVIFDLYGRRVLEPEKGNIYIINGKKVLVK